MVFLRSVRRVPPVNNVQKEACGPVSVLEFYSALGDMVTQGFRKGAHMAQLNVNHPDVVEFINCKRDNKSLSNFNISVQLFDDFMDLIGNDIGALWPRISPHQSIPEVTEIKEPVYVNYIWNQICENAWKTGDPGVVFINRVWDTAPHVNLPQIQSSNPCGEEFLEDFNSCCLGSINLEAHLIVDATVSPSRVKIDWEGLEKTVKLAVRFLDDVVDANVYPLPEIEEVTKGTRRIGLGVMGWADMLARLGIPYDSEEAYTLAEKVMSDITMWAREASHLLALEKGSYPYKRLDGREQRNASVTTIAPTGTISRIADVNSGIEPFYSLVWESNVLWNNNGAQAKLFDCPSQLRNDIEKIQPADGIRCNTNNILRDLLNNPEKAKKFLSSHGVDLSIYRTAHEISPEAHLRMQAAFQKHTTNSISKTINLPRDATVKDVSDIFKLAYKLGLKAVTVYRDGSKDSQVLTTQVEEKEKTDDTRGQPSIGILPLSLPNSSPVHGKAAPRVLKGETHQIRTGHGNMYVTINEDGSGGDERHAVETFINIGKSGGCTNAMTEALGRLISLALHNGVKIEDVIKQLHGISCGHTYRVDGKHVLSIPDGVAHILAEYRGCEDLVSLRVAAAENDFCVSCGGGMIHQDGCEVCQTCGLTKCD